MFTSFGQTLETQAFRTFSLEDSNIPPLSFAAEQQVQDIDLLKETFWEHSWSLAEGLGIFPNP